MNTNKKSGEAQRIIDVDNLRLIQLFDKSDTEIKLNEYKAMSRWKSVSVDIDGDIICSEHENYEE